MSDIIENEGVVELTETKKRRGRPPKKAVVEGTTVEQNQEGAEMESNIGDEGKNKRFHMVKEGECLMSIAKMEYGDYKKSRVIREANNINDGVKVGQVLVIP